MVLSATPFLDKVSSPLFYDQIDFGIARAYLPFLLREQIDMTMMFPNKTFDVLGHVHTCVGVQALIFADHDVDVERFATPSTVFYLNEYAKVFKIYSRSAELMDELTKINMETFAEMHVISKEDVKGYHDSEKERLYVEAKTKIEDLPLMKGMRVDLQNQKRNGENGTWMVESVDEDKAVLHRNATPYEPPNRPLEIYEKLDDKYVCYNDRDNRNRDDCISPYDRFGQPKIPGVWDKRCEKHTDCPFYQSNKQYENYRGGCDNGYCELPLGVTRISYRKYRGKPVCRGCDVDEKDCCLKTRDFVFAGDDLDRLS
jgi:hypothetical protein